MINIVNNGNDTEATVADFNWAHVFRYLSLAMGNDGEGNARSCADMLLAARDMIDTKLRALPASNLDEYRTACPEGYNTVVGWIVENCPEQLTLMDDPIADTIVDGRRLRAECRRLGVEPVKVDAFPAAVRSGIDTINAYPTRLVERYFEGGNIPFAVA